MAAILLTVIASVFIAAMVWLLAGSRVSLSPDQQVNDIVNLIIYFGLALPGVFVAVFFGLGA